MKATVKPELFQWACKRAGHDVPGLSARMPQLSAWIRGTVQPTLKQVERFASVTHTPIGYLFLPEPPTENMPIPDFRTMGNGFSMSPSPDLLDTIFLCQQRQEWYRDFATSSGERAPEFVGSASLKSDVAHIAGRMRQMLRFDLEERRQVATWTDALRMFVEQADALGVLVMVNGVVGSNNRRKLDPREFRGFALADHVAPVVFLNGADTKAAQMFTLAHELAHIWLGESAVSNVEPASAPVHDVEKWCNSVAAEMLVPLSVLRAEYRADNSMNKEVARLARRFKVSSLVILRRLHDAGYLSREQMRQTYNAEIERLNAIPKGSGGNFYLTQAARVSKRFARALVVSTLEVQTLHRDAFRLLGFSKFSTFCELGQKLGVV